MSTKDNLTAKTISAQDPMTTARPSAPKQPDCAQCDPGQKDFRRYTVRDSVGTLVASLLVPKTAGNIGVDKTTYTPGTEYWFAVSTATPVRSLTITWVDYWWTDTNLTLPAGPLSFTMAQAPRWTSTTMVPMSGPTMFVGSGLVISWDIRYVGNAWQGTLGWFNTTGTNDVFSGVQPHGGVTLQADTAVRTGAWFNTAVAPG
jgi:hypothetical protein